MEVCGILFSPGPAHWLLLKPSSCSSLWSSPSLDLMLITQVLLIDCCSNPVPTHPCDQALPLISCSSHRSCSLTAAQTQFLLIPVIKPFPGSHTHHTGLNHTDGSQTTSPTCWSEAGRGTPRFSRLSSGTPEQQAQRSRLMSTAAPGHPKYPRATSPRVTLS